MGRMQLTTRLVTAFVGLAALSFGLSVANASLADDAPKTYTWRTAPRHSAGIAPDPVALRDTAIVQVYVAPTYGWRRYVAVHPWIIFKRSGETHYSRYEVISWGSGDKVRRNSNLADGYWYGSRPRLLVDRRGPEAEALIPQIQAAIASYPWPTTYHAWPGPNSNTFIAHIGREVPDLRLDLPANAVGKDYRPIYRPIGLPPSGRGLQISLLGVAGVTLGVEEGFELNVLGLNVGLDFTPLRLRLPFIGGVGSDNLQEQ